MSSIISVRFSVVLLRISVKYVNLPLQYEYLKDDIIDKIKNIFYKGDFILGSEVKNLEERFARYCDCKYALGVGNGTDALFLVIKALNIGKDDEVITAPNSFISTAGAIAIAGAKPVFVDVRDDYNINPHLIEDAITSKTKAILPVHLTGRPADMNPILEIAKKHDLFIIEDAAQAIGAVYNDKKTGSFGIAGCFSLHPLKNLNAGGDGGMITTNDLDLYEKLIKLRNHGLRNRDECEFWGYNSRLDSIQAAIVNVKLDYLDEWHEKLRNIVDIYQKKLNGIVSFPRDESHLNSTNHLFMIQCEKRDELQNYLSKKDIETKVHYPLPIHLQEPAKKLGYKEGDFPIAELQSKRILSLPIYPELTDEQINIVTEEIKNFYSHNN